LDPLLQKLKKDNGELTDDMLILMTEVRGCWICPFVMLGQSILA
jgi:hypothetical protein